jgi:hypothetical protein
VAKVKTPVNRSTSAGELWARLRFEFDRRIRPAQHHLHRPVFIVGCGRSGTTILGRLLSQPPSIAYLNEPRDIWALDPRTDIWSEHAQTRTGQLKLTAADARPETAAALDKAFASELHRQGGGVLIEKLPINSFRIGYIAALFPDARFIHMIRSGLEVARSIARETENPHYQWYGHNDYKWQLLVDLARDRGLSLQVETAQPDMFLRGLLEWRLSVETALEALADIAQDRQLTLRYQQLIEDPVNACEALESFLDLPADPAMRQFARDHIVRQSTPMDIEKPTERQVFIGGDLLHTSIEEAW